MKKNTLYFLLFLFCSSSLFPQLASWNPNGVGGYGPSPWPATSTNSNVTVGGLTRGAGVGTGGTAAASAWGGVNWMGAANEDATFTLAGNPGCTVSYSSFNLVYRRSGTGPSAGTLEYTYGTSTTYTVIANLSFASTATGGVAIPAVNLSGVAGLQNVPPGTVVKFRIFPTGASGTTGTWYTNGGGMSVNGTITKYLATIAKTGTIQCNGQSTGALTASASGGTGPYTYSWAPAGGTSSVATGLAAGIYSCTATDANSAVTTATFNLTEPTALTASVASQTNVTCFGGSDGATTLSVSGGSAGYTYSWSPGGITTSSLSNLSAGDYTCSISDANNCVTSQTVTISQPTNVVMAMASASAICSNGTVTLNGAGVSTYTWTDGINTLMDDSPFSPSVTASYTVNGTDTISGCSSSATLSILVNANPTVTALPSSSAICLGAMATATASGATTYTWSTNATSSLTTLSPTVTSNYTVTGTDGNGCSSSATLDIVVNSNPTVNIVLSSTVVCSGQTVSLSGGGASTYTWSSGLNDGSAFSPSVTDSYSVTGTDVNGCTGTAVATVSVNSTPTISISSSATNNSVCSGASLSFTASGADTYTWNGGIVNGTPFTPTASSAYTVNGTSLNGCGNSGTVSIAVDANPTITVNSSKTTLCNGESAVLTAGSAVSYSWSTNETTANITVTPSVTTSYTVTAAGANGCSSKASITQSVSACTAIETAEQKPGLQLVLFPNPTNGAFTLKSETALSVVILNEVGQAVMNLTLNGANHYEAHVEHLTAGIYFVCGSTETIRIQQKIIVTD